MDESIKKRTVVTTVIALLLIALGTGAWVKYGSPFSNSKDQTASIINSEDDQGPIMTITAKHQFKDGKHIVAGEVNLPTPCHILIAGTSVAESQPEQVTIALNSKIQEGDICVQVITTQRFKVEFAASEGAILKATWNGRLAELNLIPAGSDEDLTNFEIFIKG